MAGNKKPWKSSESNNWNSLDISTEKYVIKSRERQTVWIILIQKRSYPLLTLWKGLTTERNGSAADLAHEEEVQECKFTTRSS